MKRKLSILLLLSGIMTVIYSCASVPLTNRRQLDIIPGSMMMSMRMLMMILLLEEMTVMMTKHQHQPKPQYTYMIKPVKAIKRIHGDLHEDK